MQVPDPCYKCDKRTLECRLTCGKYKIYHALKLKEYERRLKICQAKSDIVGHISKSIYMRKKRSVKYTPPKNDGLKK